MKSLLGFLSGLSLPGGAQPSTTVGALSGPFTVTPQHPDWCLEGGCKPPNQQ
jgi:hypothetical protein